MPHLSGLLRAFTLAAYNTLAKQASRAVFQVQKSIMLALRRYVTRRKTSYASKTIFAVAAGRMHLLAEQLQTGCSLAATRAALHVVAAERDKYARKNA